ncbi:MAG TPA: three-Cys-motif partner protein TcmP [Verrucomicrobiae bacterium]|nr:three-Cys-motif partner protein TcmP [Verrucomicrobiae bacterium]
MDFHSELKAWSGIKHKILGQYLSLFLGKLGGLGKHVHYIDGFAGQGRYDKGEKGSPLIAAELAESPPQESRRGVLRCINVEAKKSVFANLEEATKTYVASGMVQNYNGRFEDVLPKILTDIDGDPAFFFIDPFGTEGAEISTLATIAKRKGVTEVLVRFDDTRVHRLIQWTASNIESLDEKHRKTAEAFLSRVSHLADAEAIQAVLAKGEDPRQALINGYENLVKKHCPFTYSLSYPIRNPDTGGHHYFLVHFCNFADGYTYMANFMAKVERTWRSHSREQSELLPDKGTQLEMLTINKEAADQVEKAAVRTLVANLPELFVMEQLLKSTVQCRKIYAMIVDRFGWNYTRKEWIKALRELESNQVLSMSGSNDNDNVTVY